MPPLQRLWLPIVLLLSLLAVPPSAGAAERQGQVTAVPLLDSTATGSSLGQPGLNFLGPQGQVLVMPPTGVAAPSAPGSVLAGPTAQHPASLQGQVVLHAPGAGALSKAPTGMIVSQPPQLVTLIDAGTGAIVARTYSNGSGAYAFTNLPPGSYQVQVGYPATTPGPIVAAPQGATQTLPPVVVGAGH